MGRPRNVAIDDTILLATIEVVAARGLADTTSDEIAARAHVGKDSIYRRWPGKHELFVAMADRLATLRPDVPDTGSVMTDLERYLEEVEAALREGTFGRALRGLVSAAAVDPELGEAVARIWGAITDDLAQILDEAADQGVLLCRPGDQPFAVMLAGSVVGTWLLSADAAPRPPIRTIVHATLDGWTDQTLW
jgi:AcrR family transcriptional regulator